MVELSNTIGWVCIDTTSYNISCYADDVLVTSSTVTGLQRLINMADKYISSHGRFRGLAVACWTTDHYHPCSNLGVGNLKVVSSLTSPHYLWRSFGPFSLPGAQKCP